LKPVQFVKSQLFNRGTIICDDFKVFDSIREHFTVENPTAFMFKTAISNRYFSAISPSGVFKLGMFFDILDYVYANITTDISVDDEIIKSIVPFEGMGYTPVTLPKITYRDYQLEAITLLLRYGRGTVFLPTASGKSAIIAGLYYSLYSQNLLTNKSLLVLTSGQLVEQFISDCADYGVPNEYLLPFTSVSQTSKDALELSSAKLIVTNRQYLERESNIAKLPAFIDSIFVDEMDVINKTSKICRTIDTFRTNNRFGCTGTMSDNIWNRWETIGVLGKPVLFKYPKDLKDDVLNRFEIYTLKFKFTKEQVFSAKIYQDVPPEIKLPAKIAQHFYSKENQYFFTHDRVQSKLAQLLLSETENTLVIFDNLEVGDKLYELLNRINTTKNIFLVNGKTKIDDRENIRSSLEQNTDNILLAQSQTITRGVNIKNLRRIYLFCSGTKGSKIIQAVGRILRLGQNTSVSKIYDVSSNMKYSTRHANKRQALYYEYYSVSKNNIKQILIDV
jgi:superfamily II DNA or RNA helicase